jgi:predicted nucleotidyltransferase
MSNMEEIKQKLHQELPRLKQEFPIQSLALFGSYVRNEQTAASDVDIIVEFNDNIGWEFLDLQSELEKLLVKKVDLISKRGIKPRYWEYLKDKLVYV